MMHHVSLRFMNASQIAASLLEASREKTAPKDILDDLFPFIYTASKRMSGRAISQFLAKSHGVTISQATISRALKEPAKYISDFARSAFERANTVMVLLGLDGHDRSELLDNSSYAQFLRDKITSPEGNESSLHEQYEMFEVNAALMSLIENWHAVSQDFRDLCRDEIMKITEERNARYSKNFFSSGNQPTP